MKACEFIPRYLSEMAGVKQDEIARELRGECAFAGRIACLQGGSIQWME